MIVLEMILAMINKLGIIIILAIIISKIGIFKKVITKKEITMMDKMFLSIVFGAIGIMGTYSSVPINGALANTRVVGVMVGALLGGPVVGVLAGSIAGIHRYLIDIGGFTALSCGISTIVEGIIGGFACNYIKNRPNKWKHAFFIGVFAEIVQMLIILMLARPFQDALNLVKIILLPMVLVNSLGIAIFIAIIENIYAEYERIAAGQANKALKIANLTLPHLRKGLNYEVAQRVVEIIFSTVDVAAIAITDQREILAHRGVGEDHHRSGYAIQTEITKRVLQSGKHVIINNKSEMQCIDERCMLRSAIVVPLKEHEAVVGTLKLYKKDENSITPVDVELALGLAQLFSTQIELSRLDYQRKLLIEAELKTLQSQINPHFLFNAINTIVSFMLFDVERAKDLLISLADLFRKSLRSNQELVDIQTELQHIESYLEIEKARFGDKLQVKYELEDNLFFKFPPLILQPIIENAVIHGILPKKQGGLVTIRSSKAEKDVLLEVIDNGVGIDHATIENILAKVSDAKSVGLQNVNKRLINLYGEDYKLIIKSEADKGTVVQIKIPRHA